MSKNVKQVSGLELKFVLIDLVGVLNTGFVADEWSNKKILGAAKAISDMLDGHIPGNANAEISEKIRNATY